MGPDWNHPPNLSVAAEVTKRERREVVRGIAPAAWRFVLLKERTIQRASRDPHEGGAGPRVAPCGGLWGATPRKCVVYKASGSASPFPRILLAKKKIQVCSEPRCPSVFLYPWSNKFLSAGQQQTLDSPSTQVPWTHNKIHTVPSPQERINSYSPEIGSYLTSLGRSFLILKGALDQTISKAVGYAVSSRTIFPNLFI